MKKFIEDLNKQLDAAKVVRSSNSHYNKGYLFGINTAKVLLHETSKAHKNETVAAFSFKLSPEMIASLNRFHESIKAFKSVRFDAPHFEFPSGSPIANEKGPELIDFHKKNEESLFAVNLSELKRECKNWKTLFHQAQVEKHNLANDYEAENKDLYRMIEVLNVEQRELIEAAETIAEGLEDEKKITDHHRKMVKTLSEQNIKLNNEVHDLHQDIDRKNWAFAENTEMLINELAEFKEKNYFSRNQATHSPAEYQEHQIATYQKQISELNHNLERQNKNCEFAWSKVDKIKTERNCFIIFSIIFLFLIFYLINY